MNKMLLRLIALLTAISLLCGCELILNQGYESTDTSVSSQVEETNESTSGVSQTESSTADVSETASGESSSAQGETETATEVSDTTQVESEPASDSETGQDETDTAQGGHTVADSYEEAIERSKNGILSGSLTVPDQAPTLSEYQPKKDGKFVKNNEPYYIDENTYVLVDAYGNEVMRIYRGGGYITLEEVAAYVYAFGDVPANYISGKNMSPSSSIWGEYLRLNHSKFSGNTQKYPYEPVLPDISGCGGDLQYYEIDIGTTGTDCDPHYIARIYNDGDRITRGAARIVYARFDENGNKIIEPDEKYVFYTFNHYNDFQEYLNYYGGWGEIFGNITGGGTISSKTDYNPTPYVPVVSQGLTDNSLHANNTVIYAWVDKRAFELIFVA